MNHNRKIAVIGLGYVGLPVAVAFARAGAPVIGYDIDKARIEELRAGHDRTHEVERNDLGHKSLVYAHDASALKAADFFIVTVPTPIDSANRPDLGAMLAASRTVGGMLEKGDIVVYESTVYPGAIEEDCVPVLEEVSGLKAGHDFAVGYSPERINPGDKEHGFERILKVVAGEDTKTLERVAALYGSVVTAGIHCAPSIKVAEAAKALENTQRDLNIALMNEMAIICDAMGIRTHDVLEAAGTKWNFLKFSPGLVGGHCIGVDPYYLTSKAQELGYNPQVILAGRRINDSMGNIIARRVVRFLASGSHLIREARVGVLGLTFKENVPDIRNSRVPDILAELKTFGIKAMAHDPLANAREVVHEYGLTMAKPKDLTDLDALILAVPHKEYLKKPAKLTGMLREGGIFIDIKSAIDPAALPGNLSYWSL